MTLTPAVASAEATPLPSSLVRRARPTLVGTFEVKQREVEPVSDGVVRRARAVAEAMFATSEGPDGAPPADRLDWVGRELRGFLGHSPDASRVFRLCLFAVTTIGPLFSFRVGFEQHTLAERIKLLERVEHSPLSTALLGLKAVLCMLYFEHPDAARSIGAPVGDESCKIQVAK